MYGEVNDLLEEVGSVGSSSLKKSPPTMRNRLKNLRDDRKGLILHNR